MSAPAAPPPVAPYRSEQRAGRDGFAQLVRAEWTKFRTVRGWVVATVIAVLMIAGVGIGSAAGSHQGCEQIVNNSVVSHTCPSPPLGQGGERVNDGFYFVHQTLTGDGSITTRVTSLTEQIPDFNTQQYASSPGQAMTNGLVPWAKAGVIIKQSPRQGSAYAAMMVTGSHGVRMQYDFTHDTAGSPAGVSSTSPVWLRLTRSGDVITGYESTDGVAWTRVGTATLTGLPSSVQIGLFTASPDYTATTDQHIGFSSGIGGSSRATGVFDNVSLAGTTDSGGWHGVDLGGDGVTGPAGIPLSPYQDVDGRFTVTGSGDIAPTVSDSGGGSPVQQSLAGTFIGLIVLIVIAAMFVTAEYRRGLIRTTLAASPRRGRVLLAKALVVGAVAFVAGLVAAVVTIPIAKHLQGHNGFFVLPLGALTETRVIVGTALVLAVCAMIAVAIGAVLRRSAAAVTATILVIILPYLLAILQAVPLGPANWILRLTPGAAFAMQQTVVRYAQVDATYAPANGYYPLAPWAGFAVLCAWAAVALGVAGYLMRRRDV